MKYLLHTMKQLIRSLVVMLLLTMTMAGQAQTSVPKPKRIYITQDVSGSMEGNKYLMANYAAQSIAVFSNEEDRVYVYYLGSKHDISSAEGYKNLQIEYNNLKGKNAYYEISDVSQFLKDYKANAQYQDWLFIIGDGDWNYGKAKAEFGVATLQLAQLIEDNDMQVCYLQTGNVDTIKYDFTTFLESLNAPTVDIRCSDTTASSVLGNCVYFTNRILGFSHTNVQLYQQDDRIVSFCSEYPLERCLLVYQTSQTVADETKIVKTTCNETILSVVVKGNPSTKKLVPKGKPFLNGMVWELSSPQTIPANDTVKVQFNQKVDVKNLKLYPYVDVAIVAKDTLVEASPNRFYICEKEDEALIRLMATDKFGRIFPPPLMRKMDVRIVVGNDTLSMNYDAADTSFFVVAAMPDQELSYFAFVESPGYFSRVSSLQTIVKKAEVCPPEWVPMITLPMQQFDPVTFETMFDGQGFGGRVDDSLLRIVAGSGSFEEVSLNGHDSWMLESGGVSFENGNIMLVQQPKSGLCECVFPNTLRYEVTLRSERGIQHDGKLYEGFVIPIEVPLEHREWWERCWVYVAVFGGLLLFLLYLRAMRKKHRFRKDAIVRAFVIDRFGNVVDKHYQQYLRNPKLGAWFARWFWPGDEKNTLTFVSPRIHSIDFIAGTPPSTIMIYTKIIDGQKIRVATYTPPEGDQKPPEFVELNDNDTIDVWKNNIVKEGFLEYVSGNTIGGGGFRFFNFILTLVAFAAECLVVWMLIKSLTTII